MNKKEYKKPLMTVIALEDNDIICTSNGGVSTLSIFDEEVDDEQQGSTSTGWGSQW